MSSLSIKPTPQFHFELITPSKVLFSEEVYEVVLPTKQGEIAVLADHIAYLSGLRQGVISVVKQKGQPPQPLCEVANGFVEFHHNHLTVVSSIVTMSHN